MNNRQKVIFAFMIIVSLITLLNAATKNFSENMKINNNVNSDYFNGFESRADFDECGISDKDGDGNNWTWYSWSPDLAHNGSGFIGVYCNPNGSNDWIWFPKKTSWSNASFSFWVNSANSGYLESFKVVLRIYDGSDFQDVLIDSVADYFANYTQYSYTIPSEYSGYEVEWNIVHTTLYASTLLIDDVFIKYGEPNPQVTVLSPNGGEIWEEGSKHNILWEYSELIYDDYINIEYSTDGGNSWNFITNENKDCLLYNWTTPNITSSNCLVKISAVNSLVEDISDETFSITVKSPVYFSRIEFYNNVEPNSSNQNNYIDYNIPVRFKVRIKNDLSQNILTGYSEISTSNPYITITDSKANFNNVTSGENAWSSDEYEIVISEDCPIGSFIEFALVVTQSISPVGPWFSSFKIPIKPLSINQVFTDDDNNPDSQGNNNGIVEPNETIEIIPIIKSFFNDTIYNVSGELSSQYDFINVWDCHSGNSGIVYTEYEYNVISGESRPVEPNELVQPEYDYVFDYNAADIYEFSLNLIVSAYFGDDHDEYNDWDEGGILIKWNSSMIINTGEQQLKIESNLNMPFEYSLSQNYPNPFNPVTNIKYAIPEQSHVTLKIINSAGQVVDVLVNKKQSPGYYTIQWDASGVSSGIYFYRIDIGEFCSVKKCLVVK